MVIPPENKSLQSNVATSQLNITYLMGLSFIASLGGFLFGFDVAVISGTIPLVRTQFTLNPLMEGWYVSCALVGCMIGTVVAGILGDAFGRKKTLILSASLFLLSALGCMIAGDIHLLIASRFIGGIGVGVASMLSPLYLSEIAPKQLRGRLVTFYQLALTIGILCAYFSNSWLLKLSNQVNWDNATLGWVVSAEPWRAMFGMGSIPSVLFFILLFFLPESPRWLVKKGKRDTAFKIFARISNARQANTELTEVDNAIIATPAPLSELLKPYMRKPLIIGILLSLFVQFSGINAIIYYGPSIFSAAGFTLSASLDGQVTIGLINTIFTLIAVWTIDRLGRKRLLLIGSIGVIVALLSIGLLFFLGLTSNLAMLILFLGFVAFFALSLGPVNWVIISEIFPTSVRGRAMAVATLTVWLGTALVGQLFPWSLAYLGPANTFWIFASICIIMLPVLYNIIPETKGKSLEKIEKLWRAGNN